MLNFSDLAKCLRDQRRVEVEHYDETIGRTLKLAAFVEDANGQVLDVPVPCEVLSVVLYRTGGHPFHLSYRSGTLCVAAAEAVLREFKARLSVDRELRRWLIAAATAKHLKKPPLTPEPFPRERDRDENQNEGSVWE